MKTETKIITIKSAIAVATLALFSSASPAMAQTAPDLGLTRNLRAIATGFGDQDGQISRTNAAGQTEIVAHGQQHFTVYTAGSDVYYGTLVLCTLDSQAGLSSCAPLDFSVGGGGTNYECTNGPEEDDPDCQCTGQIDCISMWISGDCSSDLDCDDYGCSCLY